MSIWSDFVCLSYQSTSSEEIFAFIEVKYSQGYVCTCVQNDVTLTAPADVTRYVFSLPSSGTWTLSATNSSDIITQTVTITTKGQIEVLNLTSTLLINSISSNILSESYAYDYVSGDTTWGDVNIEGSGYSKEVNTYDVLRLTTTSFAEYTLPSTNYSVTAYAYINNYTPTGGDLCYFGVPQQWSTSRAPAFFIRNNTIWTTVYGSGSDASTNQTADEWHVLTISIDGTNKIAYYYVDGVAYSSKNFTESGSLVSFSAATSATQASCNADIAWFGIVDGVETSQTIISNQQNIMNYFSTPLPENPYLTFQSADEFTLAVYAGSQYWDGILEYSTDTTTWNEWDGTTTLSSSGGRLYLRGTGNTIICGDYEEAWELEGVGIECIGNIETLLDYQTVVNGEHPQMADYAFSGLFYNCANLTAAPALSATTLSAHCYAYMFDGCTSLTAPPALPATTLAEGCYEDMFSYCSSLTTVPLISATTLANSCCYAMFYGCTSIKLSTTQDSTYRYAYRIPSSGTGIDATNAMNYMFTSTGGTFTGTPTINTTYYTDHPPI